MNNNIIAEVTPAVNMVLADGVHFDETINEHVVVVSGQIVNYATHWSTACHQYTEALRAIREHFQSCPSDAIPFDGSPVPYESEADDYGLMPEW